MAGGRVVTVNMTEMPAVQQMLREAARSLAEMRAQVAALTAENARLREMSELQDRLLVCYRVGKRPGKWLDRLEALRDALGEAAPVEATAND